MHCGTTYCGSKIEDSPSVQKLIGLMAHLCDLYPVECRAALIEFIFADRFQERIAAHKGGIRSILIHWVVNKKDMTLDKEVISKILAKNEEAFVGDLLQLANCFLTSHKDFAYSTSLSHIHRINIENKRPSSVIEFLACLLFISPELLHHTLCHFRQHALQLRTLVSNILAKPESISKATLSVSITKKDKKSSVEKFPLPLVVEKIVEYNFSHHRIDTYRAACLDVVETLTLRLPEAMSTAPAEVKAGYDGWMRSLLKNLIKTLNMNKHGNIHAGSMWEWKRSCRTKLLGNADVQTSAIPTRVAAETASKPAEKPSAPEKSLSAAERIPPENAKLLESFRAVSELLVKSNIRGSELHLLWILVFRTHPARTFDSVVKRLADPAGPPVCDGRRPDAWAGLHLHLWRESILPEVPFSLLICRIDSSLCT